jgi:hypothetical protein
MRMSKFNSAAASAARSGVITTTGERTLTAEGGPGFVRDAKSELFLLAVGSFLTEDKFYESGDEGTTRFRTLVDAVTKEDPAWMREFLPWLRHRANIRTAAIVGAAEYVRAGGAGGRKVVGAVLSRADEPGELLAYWTSQYGRRIPQPIKRGVADSLHLLYTQQSVAKWDSARRAFRFADVVELTHPAPVTPTESALYRWLLDDRRARGVLTSDLEWLYRREQALRSHDPRAALLTELQDGNPTVTWETVSSAGVGKLSASEWLALYEHMGYMARLRNLRNLDEAGVSFADKQRIGMALADPEQVAKSKQLPMRFLSAWHAVNDVAWHPYLSQALDASLEAVPTLPGKWLVMLDASGSMSMHMSSHSAMTCYSAGSVFAAAFARRNDAQIRTYSNAVSPVFPKRAGENTLQTVNRLGGSGYWMGGGTYTAEAVKVAFNEGSYDHVLLITDEQAWFGDPSNSVPKSVPLYTFNVAGHRAANTETNFNRVTVGGLSDAGFQMMAAIESARGGSWPWEA